MINIGSNQQSGCLKPGLVKLLASLLLAVLIYCPGPAFASESRTSVDINEKPVRDKWALIVGISNFENGNIPVLKFAAKDARDFRDFLVNEANFAPDHVRLILNEKATERRVLSELGNKYLARVAKPDDLVVLYFSTHGSPSHADIRGKNFLVAYDTDPDELFTTGIDMGDILEIMKSRILSKRVLLVMDACHSGAVTPGSKALSRVGNFDVGHLAAGSGQMVISSSQSDQRSWESKRYDNGIFTRKLIDGLRVKGKKTRMGEAFPFIEDSVAAEAQEDYAARQKPTLKSRWDGNELVLAVPPARPQRLPQSVKAILKPDSTNEVIGQVSSSAQSAAKDSLSAVAGDYASGQKLYKSGNFGSAIKVLQGAVATGAKNNPDAHYLLASALSKLDRTDEAIRAYSQCYQLNPKGPKAAECLERMTRFSGGKTGKQSKVVAARPPSSSPLPVVSDTEEDRADSGTQSVLSSLPALKKYESEKPSLTETYAWDTARRARYRKTAAERQKRAARAVKKAENVLKAAEAILGATIPEEKNEGESDDAFKRRREDALKRYDELIAPYRQELASRRKILTEEKTLLNSCVSAESEYLTDL